MLCQTTWSPFLALLSWGLVVNSFVPGVCRWVIRKDCRRTSFRVSGSWIKIIIIIIIFGHGTLVCAFTVVVGGHEQQTHAGSLQLLRRMLFWSGLTPECLCPFPTPGLPPKLTSSHLEGMTMLPKRLLPPPRRDFSITCDFDLDENTSSSLPTWRIIFSGGGADEPHPYSQCPERGKQVQCYHCGIC